MSTLDWTLLMERALEQARIGESKGEVPVGAVLTNGTGAIIASGFNQPISSHDPSGHAEILALRAAGARLGNYRLPGTTLVVTVEPCLMCAGALINARIARVVFGAKEPKWGAFGSLIQVESLRLNHQIEVIAGVREEECSRLLQSFFRSRRDVNRKADT